MNISVSDLNAFLRCRRAWDLTSANRQSLRHKATPRPYLVTGSAVHAAIEGQANGRHPMEALEDYLDEETIRQREAYNQVVGSGPWPEEWAAFNEACDLARDLTRQYFDHYGYENPLVDLGLRYFASEASFRVPLRPGVDFVGTFDGLAVDIETGTRVFLVENKTAGQRPHVDGLQHSNQLVGYAWAFQMLTGKPVAGVVYNGIIKKLIQPPKVLKNGRFSVAKDALVTLRSFMTAVQESGADPVQYLDYIGFLEDREREGDDRFFVRQVLHFPQTQLQAWGMDLRRIVADMTDGPNIYPNFSNPQACAGCFVRDLCDAQQLGEDTDAINAQRYVKGAYGTVETVRHIQPQMVSSVADLVDSLRGQND